jgi:hypothetical protein
VSYAQPSGSFVHAAHFAALMIQVSEHLFPSAKLFELSPDQRRLVTNETTNLIVQARWVVDSKGFADQLAGPQSVFQEAVGETILGTTKKAQGNGGSGSYV